MADLTRDAILALPAGPEMDALVAERVLGIPRGRWLSVCREQGHRTDDYEYDASDGDESGWCYVCGVSVCEAQKCPPRYSTDIAAAWTVVEHMRAAGWHPLIGYCDEPHDRPMPEVQFIHDSGAPASFVNCYCNRCDTMPHSICVAALMAKLGLDDQEERTDG